jgi:ATP/maltotriose-dependent transcriptional regulator MalT
LLGVNEVDDARRTLEGLEALIGRWQLTSAVTDAARLRGQLAEASGDVDEAQAAYAAGLAGGPGLPLPTARLEVTYARLLRQLGAKRAAIEQLRRARHRLARLAARPFLAWCDEELTACGVAAPRGSGDRLGLTAAELSVAHLVAQGLSNRETAERLYVSVKAVEYHLGHIYAKLGISSRRQLAGRLAEPHYA